MFRTHRSTWKYVNARDAVWVASAYGAVSLGLLALRYGLPESLASFRVPTGVIVIEFLLSTQAALAIRLLRRAVHERESLRRRTDLPTGTRRVVLVGAGTHGSVVAKDMVARPEIDVIGFLDDDPKKIGTVIAGVSVIGPTSLLTELARANKIDEVLICIRPERRESASRIVDLLKNSTVTSRIVPTIEEILGATDTVRVINGALEKANHKGSSGNGHKAANLPREDRVENLHIAITGGAGFIGSSLAECLVGQNQVTLIDRTFDRQPLSFTSLAANRNVRLVEADIMESEKLKPILRDADVIVHAAAIVGVERVCQHPRETLEVNFEGTSRLLRVIEHSPRLKRFLYFSTSEVFGVNSFRVSEMTPTAVGPAAEARWSYSIAKLAGEHLVKSYDSQSGLPSVIIRPFNVFGPRRTGKHAILNFVRNVLQGNPLEVHGDGSQIRSWCYIDDFCSALVAMIARPEAVGEDFNIGNPTNTVTIYQLACRIKSIMAAPIPIMFLDPGIPDIGIRVPSLEKARHLLGFDPRTDLEHGLELTIDWYRKHPECIEMTSGRSFAASSR